MSKIGMTYRWMYPVSDSYVVLVSALRKAGAMISSLNECAKRINCAPESVMKSVAVSIVLENVNRSIPAMISSAIFVAAS